MPRQQTTGAAGGYDRPETWSHVGRFYGQTAQARPPANGASDDPVNRVTNRFIRSGTGWFSLALGLTQLVAPGWLTRTIGVRDTDDARTLQRVCGAREIASGIGVLASANPAPWLWARVGGDVMDLVLLGMAFNSKKANRTRLALATASVLKVAAFDLFGAVKFSRQSATAARSSQERPMQTRKSIVVNRPVDEVYQFWRDFESFPRFMMHLESVRSTGGQRSHWKAIGPAGKSFEWDAEIVEDRPNETIAWRSLPGADVENSGVVHFERAPGGRGALAHVEMSFKPPAGAIGMAVASLFGSAPGQEVTDDLRRFKQLIETGEVVRSDASVHLTPHAAQPTDRRIPLEAEYRSSSATRPAVRSTSPAGPGMTASGSDAETDAQTPSAAAARGGAR